MSSSASASSSSGEKVRSVSSRYTGSRNRSISPQNIINDNSISNNNNNSDNGIGNKSIEYVYVKRDPLPRSRKLKNAFKEPDIDYTKDLRNYIINNVSNLARRKRGLILMVLFVFVSFHAFLTTNLSRNSNNNGNNELKEKDNEIAKINNNNNVNLDNENFRQRHDEDNNEIIAKSSNSINDNEDYSVSTAHDNDDNNNEINESFNELSNKNIQKKDNNNNVDESGNNDENLENDDDHISLSVGVGKNGCPFGFVSLPGEDNSYCYYLGLEPASHTHAEYECKKLGAHLATITTKNENDLLCNMMSIADNKHTKLELAHIGLRRDDSTKSNPSGLFSKWEDGTPYDHAKYKDFWVEGEPDGKGYKPPKDPTAKYLRGLFGIIHCRKGGKWVDWSTLKLPYFCSMEKPPKNRNSIPFIDEDGTQGNEIYPIAHWHPTSLPLSSKCLWKPINHGNVLLSSLPRQYPWTIGKRKKGSKKRYYAIWQTKHYFGYQRYWVGYLEEEQSFYPVPLGDLWHGSFGSSSSSSSSNEKHTGYFHSPATLAKYRPRAIFSRLTIPSSVLVHFHEGTLVNQIFTVDRTPLGDKQLLLIALTKFAKQYNCDLEESGIFLLSFDMSDKNQCLSFVKYVSISRGADNSNEAEDAIALERNLEFVKAAQSDPTKLDPSSTSDENNEESTKISSNNADSEPDVTEESTLLDSDFTKTAWMVKGSAHGGLDVHVMRASKVVSRYGIDCHKVRNETVQRYLTNPLLLDDRKFDVRAFMLVASTKPLIVYVYNETYFRGASLKFTDPTSTKNKERHVTNMHIQQRSITTKIDWENYIWNPFRVARYAEKAGIPTDFASRIMIPKIKSTLQFVISAVVDSITDRRAGQWKLFGVDFVIDKNMHPWLIDINSFPGFGWTFQTPWALGYRKRMLKSMWETVLDVQVGNGNSDPNLKVPRSGGFELIYHGKLPSEDENMNEIKIHKTTIKTAIDNNDNEEIDSDDSEQQDENDNKEEDGTFIEGEEGEKEAEDDLEEDNDISIL